MKRRSLGRRQWLAPIGVLAIISIVIFVGLYLFDYFVASTHDGGQSALETYLGYQADGIGDAVPQMAAMMAAVLGIVITVVSIIVQLSADRFTGVAQMFLRDRVNILVMAYFVVACVCGVWLSMTLRDYFVPRATVTAMMAATTFGLVLMLPYFAYVFWFLEPSNIIARIREDAVTTVTRGAQIAGALGLDAQVRTVSAMEELTDITSNSISGKDKIIASRAVDALKDFALEYQAVKPQASDEWFRIGSELRDNPDFVAMDPESLEDLEERRTWVEWKILRQYLGIYREAMSAMPDINYLIAIDTRYIAEAAGLRKDERLVELCFHFMNSYLRATLNAGDVRTAYNVFNQYRLLIESMLDQGNGPAAVQGVKYMTYYGRVSFDMKLTFVTETAAYDISALCQHAHEQNAPEQHEMLSLFLELDQPLKVKTQEKGLLGVRKAQVKLAAYFLDAGEEAKARTIADDMRDEPEDRLIAIRDQLAGVESKDFWEIIDRGRNFEYMPARQRACMGTFFGWLAAPHRD
ncbi:MAG TPA: DUF2254 family protein [Kofleriaceae bacterium]|nr:DUF2254 family protein [Kofleriaceae bacterium]